MGAEERPVLIVGAGAIGSVVGARLSQAGVPAAIVGRGRHIQAIREHGLRLETAGAGDTVVRVPAFDSLSGALGWGGVPRAVMLTMKAFDVAPAAAELAAHLSSLDPSPTDTPPVVCLQNGVGAEEIALHHLPGYSIWAGVITLSVAWVEPGHLEFRTSHGGITVAPYRSRSGEGRPAADLGPLAGWLEQAGFRLWRRGRGDSVKWSKLLLNLWANATAAVFGVLPAEVAGNRDLFHLDWLAFREALAVMRRGRIPVSDLPGYPVRVLAALGRGLPEAAFRRVVGGKLVGGRGGKAPSLLLDLRAGRLRTEVSFLNGAVARTGRVHGLPTPVNAALESAVVQLSAWAADPDRAVPGGADELRRNLLQMAARRRFPA